MKTSLNEIRQTLIQNNTLYAEEIPEIFDTTDIGAFANPLLNIPDLANAFMSVLVQRIVYTQVEIKLFNNPLRILEGDRIPLGAIGQEIYINPAKGRKFNVDDFAGLLARYESDVKVQYLHLNSDLQYPVTITRAKLKDAFVSWSTLENFIDGITQSLYNGAYIDQYNLTKSLISSAYKANNVKVQVIEEPTTEEQAKAFITKARTMFLNMQLPSSNFNAWKQVGGYGREILTWSNPRDIVFIIRNDLASYLDVNVLANAFNIDKTVLMGNIIYVDNFDVYDNDGNLIFDGSKILGFMGDKSWFRIKEQETTMDEFYNANNRTWQLYLNVVRMYQYSLFANGIVWATEEPQVTITDIEPFTPLSLKVNEVKNVPILTVPRNGNTPQLTLQGAGLNDVYKATLANKTLTITGLKEGTGTLGVKIGSGKVISMSISVTQATTIPLEINETEIIPQAQPKTRKKAE